MSSRDRISQLPESVLTRILSHLTTKDSVKTSILSTRWKNLWRNVPVLDLDCSNVSVEEEEALLGFLDKFLELNTEPLLLKVNVKSRVVLIRGLRDWIGKAINRGVKDLDFESCTLFQQSKAYTCSCIDNMTWNMYTSKTLVSLKLKNSGLEFPGSVSLPCLKLLHLLNVHWQNYSNLENLLSGCPVLEELTLMRNMKDTFKGGEERIMRVRSQSLKRFYILRMEEYVDDTTRRDCSLEIDAPGLEYMSLEEDHFDSIVVTDLTSLDTVDLDIKFIMKADGYADPEDISKGDEIFDFLTGISSVKHMIVSQKTVKALVLYSKSGLIPKFINLSRLEVTFPYSLLHILPALLEICPNLKHLTMKVVDEEEKTFELRKVPLTNLECVEIRGILLQREGQLKMASYFLENAQALKKLVMGVVMVEELYEELNKVAKSSQSCEVILDGEV